MDFEEFCKDLKIREKETELHALSKEEKLHHLADYYKIRQSSSGLSMNCLTLLEDLEIQFDDLQYVNLEPEKKEDAFIQLSASKQYKSSFTAFLLGVSPSLITKWKKKHNKEILETRIDFLNDRINNFQKLIDSEDNNFIFFDENMNIADKERLSKIILESQNEIESIKQELQGLERKDSEPLINDENNEASNIPSDEVFLQSYKMLTHYKNLSQYTERQKKVSRSLDTLATNEKDTFLRLKEIRTNGKSITLQMVKPSPKVNMQYMRDLFVVSMTEISKLNKSFLSPENLKTEGVKVKISTIDIFNKSNYKNLRKIQEMSSNDYISILGTLAILGSSEIKRNHKTFQATQDTQLIKKYIPLFKSVGYANNVIELELNDVFPWESFTLNEFTLLPDNYLKLSENAKTLLFELCTLVRIKKTSEFTLSYKHIQNLLNLKDYDPNHGRERIIDPIEKTIEEINECNSIFFCIDKEKDQDRSIKEIIDNGKITVTAQIKFLNMLENINNSAEKKYKTKNEK